MYVLARDHFIAICPPRPRGVSGPGITYEPINQPTNAQRENLLRVQREARAPGQRSWRITPDFAVFPRNAPARYYEWKLAVLSVTHYRPGGGRRGRSWGAEHKAESVTTDTRRRVAELDARILGVPIDQIQPHQGPVQRAVASVGGIRVAVVGAYAEGSHHVHQLYKATVQAGARNRWARMGCASPAEAKGVLATAVRRDWSIAFWRAAAGVLIARLPAAEPDGLVAAARSHTAAMNVGYDDLLPLDELQLQPSARWARGGR